MGDRGSPPPPVSGSNWRILHFDDAAFTNPAGVWPVTHRPSGLYVIGDTSSCRDSGRTPTSGWMAACARPVAYGNRASLNGHLERGCGVQPIVPSYGWPPVH